MSLSSNPATSCSVNASRAIPMKSKKSWPPPLHSAQKGKREGHGNTLSAEISSDGGLIRNLIEKYAKSIDGADTALAAEVWLDSPEVSFIHPLGHEHGF